MCSITVRNIYTHKQKTPPKGSDLRLPFLKIPFAFMSWILFETTAVHVPVQMTQERLGNISSQRACAGVGRFRGDFAFFASDYATVCRHHGGRAVGDDWLRFRQHTIEAVELEEVAASTSSVDGASSSGPMPSSKRSCSWRSSASSVMARKGGHVSAVSQCWRPPLAR